MADLRINQSTPISASGLSSRQNSVELSEEKKKELKKLQTACMDFESIFTYQMMKEMRKTIKKTAFIHGGNAEEIFSDMLDQERSKDVTLGIGDILFNQLSKAILPTTRRR